MLDSPVRSFRRCSPLSVFFSFFFTGTATTEIYTLSLHDALPIYVAGAAGSADLANDGQDDVLRRYALRQLAVDDNAHVLRFALRSEEHTSELQSRENLVCRLLLEKKKEKKTHVHKH